MITVNTVASSSTAARAKTEAAVPPAADEKLFGQAIGGDRTALGQLIERYEKTLFGLLMRMTGGDQHRSDDLFQETFLHAMRASKATFDRKLHFKPWITAIAVNLIRDDARKRKVRGEVGLDNPADSAAGRAAVPEPMAEQENPGEQAERRDEERKVQQALNGLTDLEREVVLLHFLPEEHDAGRDSQSARCAAGNGQESSTCGSDETERDTGTTLIEAVAGRQE